MGETVSTDAPVHAESADHLSDIVADDGVALVDFYADWCGPCKMLAPTVEEIAAETAATVVKVDIDELQELAAAEGVRSVPTLKIYADGDEVEELVGVREKDELVGIVERHA